jgi:hypothetical protein
MQSPEDHRPTYDELLEENRRLREDLSRCRFDPKGEAARILTLENQRDCFVKNLLAAASTPQVSIDIVMDYMVESARTIYEETVHAILYEVRPLTGRTLSWIKENEHLDDLEDVSIKEVLFIKKDTQMEDTGQAMDDLPRPQRYLSMKHGTVVSDAFFLRQPVVSIPADGVEESIDHVHYGHYDKSRWQHVDQRAAFPVINPLSRAVEYVLVIDKGGRQLASYDIRYVRDFVNLAAFALAIKQIMAEDRRLHDNVKKGLHDLAAATQSVDQLGGVISDLLESPDPDPGRLADYRQRLSWQMARFQRLLRDLRIGAVEYDLEPQDLDRLLRSYIRTLSLHKFYGERLVFDLDLAAGDRRVLIDSFALQSVLENMVKNSFETERAAKVRITTRPADNAVRLTYYDDGGGMDDALYQGILERSRGRTTKAHGSGLGIQSILKSLRDMNCIVGAVNLPGEGFGYEALIPLAQTDETYTKTVEMG